MPMKYEPLTTRDQTDWIRVLDLQPGHRAEPIFCNLRLVRLADKPEYEALSYAWGKQQPSSMITCDGQEHEVGPNLIAALRRLRDPKTTKTVWVDAICINQADLDERGHQVRIMGPVYAQASRVNVWLGAAEDDTKLAFLLMDKINTCKDNLGGRIRMIEKLYRSASEKDLKRWSLDISSNKAAYVALLRLTGRT